MINVPILSIYDFYCDPELTEAAFQRMLNTKIDWQEANVGGAAIGYMDYSKGIPYYDPELYAWFSKCANEASKEMLNLPLTICDAWLTKSGVKQQSAEHFHSFSVLSGLFYFTDHTGSNTYFLYKDYYATQLEHIMPFDLTGAPFKRLKVKPEKGKLIIFPSFMLHGTDPHNQFGNTRYTLAFNTFIDGEASNLPSRVLTTHVVPVEKKYYDWINKETGPNDSQ